MRNKLISLAVKNFRSLADIHVITDTVNVLFGPNGAGKSTFLDTIWFIRDCAFRGVDVASSFRNHGIGALWDGATKGANISIKLETELAAYEVLFGYSSGRIEPFVGEKFYSKDLNKYLIDRKIGSDKASFYHTKLEQETKISLRDPEKLAFTAYMDFEGYTPLAAFDFDKFLRFVHFYHSRNTDLNGLKKYGSESSHHTWLFENCENLWSVLRILHDNKNVDERYDTILKYMRESFPSFKDLLIEQTGPNTIYGNFIENSKRQPIQASGVSDGHLQLLILLTALFSEGKDRFSLLMFDEPETSLHPHALAIFAKAVDFATTAWNKQIFIATHSPVLISQFNPQHIWAAEVNKVGQTMFRQVSEIEGIKDLLDEYATGSLYMAEMIAKQSLESDL